MQKSIEIILSNEYTIFILVELSNGYCKYYVIMFHIQLTVQICNDYYLKHVNNIMRLDFQSEQELNRFVIAHFFDILWYLWFYSLNCFNFYLPQICAEFYFCFLLFISFFQKFELKITYFAKIRIFVSKKFNQCSSMCKIFWRKWVNRNTRESFTSCQKVKSLRYFLVIKNFVNLNCINIY